jgi:AcrR family transcriptional regulator
MSRRQPVSPTRVGGLRERKRVAAMRQIQAVAVRLFDERGFDGVTIEEIAAVADVSLSSVYRYFGTKEGILIEDEYGDRLMSSALLLLAQNDPYDAVELALRGIAEGHFGQDEELTQRRARYFFEVPSVRASVYLRMDQAVITLAEALVASDRDVRYDPLEARVVMNSVVWALFAAVEHVTMGRSSEPLEVAIQRALDVIRPRAASALPPGPVGAAAGR